MGLSTIKIFLIYSLLFHALFLLAACNPQKSELSDREAEISAREAELVTLFAELVEQKKALESHLAVNLKENITSNKTNPCLCNLDDDSSPILNTTKDDTNIKYTKTVSGGIEKIHTSDSKILLGRTEKVYLDPPGMEFNARIDTGAQTSSLNAIDIVEFERDGKPHVSFKIINPKTKEKMELTRRIRRYARVKELNNRESQSRPVVRMRVVLADIDEQINFTLVDRSRLKNQVLIGRNLLHDLAIVDVSKRFTATKKNKAKHNNIK